ncbi:MAG TPA: GDP-mannose 4,6-dehydratase [Roseiflexaceae bacterium]|nr:GDP-mannose 4,6-dehydratase [Roseiflexaceae bacterium]
MRYLVTGGAGFIGSHLCDALLARGDEVICLDNFNDYYRPERKRRNIATAATHPNFTLVEADFRDASAVEQLFVAYRPDKIAHIGAMAGPRPSLAQPELYTAVNIHGTLTLLDAARRHGARGFLLASTSSVYGMSPTPWTEESPSDRPLSPYAATKKAAEILAYTFPYQYGVPTSVVRFFTVYGPRGRPDMTPYNFITPMIGGRPITLFNGGGGIYRDWTYIDDIVAGVIAALDSELAFEIFNLGNSSPVELLTFVRTIEKITGLQARIETQPLPAADPPITFAAIDKATRILGYRPQTDIEQGLGAFWAWYQREIAG